MPVANVTRPRSIRSGWALFALGVLAMSAISAYAYVLTDAVVIEMPEGASHYGDWAAVAFSVGLFSAVVLGFLRSPRRREWRHLGLTEAYLIALFTEMFGTPLTIYLVGSVIGARIGLGGLEGHLWAVALDRAGLLPLERGVGLVMAVSSVLITVGVALMAAGWRQVWRAKGELVTDGLYRFVRHPQYAGFLAVVTGFLIMWPTLPTLVLFPVLAAAYVRLARREEKELLRAHGGMYAEYRRRTPMLIPAPRRA